MQANRSESAPERQLRSLLHRRGLRFRKHARPVPGLRCRPDVLFPAARVVVLFHGCFWHACPDHGVIPASNREWWTAKLRITAERDAHNQRVLEQAGWLVIRVWEHEDLLDAAERIHSVVHARRATAR